MYTTSIRGIKRVVNRELYMACVDFFIILWAREGLGGFGLRSIMYQSAKNYTRRLFISARRTSWLGVLFDFVAVIVEAQCNKSSTIPVHVIGVRLLSQSASQKHNQEKKPTNLCATRKFLQNVSAIFENHAYSLVILTIE